MRLAKKRRIKRSGEFRRVKEHGESHRGRFLGLGVLRDESIPDLQVGFITTKRIGNAVVRNLMRRRMRALITETGDELESGLFLVLIARNHAPKASYHALRKEWKWLCHRAKLLKDRDL